MFKNCKPVAGLCLLSAIMIINGCSKNNPTGPSLSESSGKALRSASSEDYVYAAKWGAPGSLPGQFSSPCQICVIRYRGVNQILVADQMNNRVQRFDTIGNYLGLVGSQSAGDMVKPMGVAANSAGIIYVCDAKGSGRVTSYDFYGNLLGEFANYNPANDEGTYYPASLAINPLGNILVSTPWADCVKEYTAYGTFCRRIDVKKYSAPQSIAADSHGNIYVADAWYGQVHKYNPDGVYQKSWQQPTPDGKKWAPLAITVDISNNIYVTVYGSSGNAIFKFDSNGTVLNQWGSFGTGNGQFSCPAGIAVDISGAVYVTDSKLQRVQKFKRFFLY